MSIPGPCRAPTTETVGLIHLPIGHVIEWFVKFHSSLQNPRGVTLAVRELGSNSLHAAVDSLLPLTSVEIRRFLFIPIVDWTAYFNNSNLGSDVAGEMSLAAIDLNVRTIRVVNASGKYPARILELYDPGSDHPSKCVRVVSAANDGGRWRFDEFGERFDFEEVEKYSSRRIGDRLTPEMLYRYLEALAIPLTEESFDPERATLVEKIGPHVPDMGEFGFRE